MTYVNVFRYRITCVFRINIYIQSLIDHLNYSIVHLFRDYTLPSIHDQS